MDYSNKLIDRYTGIWLERRLYHRFGRIAAILLTLIVSVVIVFTFSRIVVEAYELVAFKDAPMNPVVFQSILGMVLTVLIAMELNHSIIQVVERNASIVRAASWGGSPSLQSCEMSSYWLSPGRRR